jgi:hypothetical protein
LAIVSGRSEAGNKNGDELEGAARQQKFDSLTTAFAQASKNVVSADQRLARARELVAKIRAQLDENKARRDEYDAQLAQLPALQALASADPESAEGKAAQQKIDAIGAMVPPESTTDLQAALANANSSVDDAVAAQAVSARELNNVRIELTNAQQAIEEMKRYDSYSVFGSFEAKTSVGVDENTRNGKAGGDAGVGLGKIFATGVASQNISDGLSHLYRTRALTACYEAVSRLAGVNAATAEATLEHCNELEPGAKK